MATPFCERAAEVETKIGELGASRYPPRPTILPPRPVSERGHLSSRGGHRPRAAVTAVIFLGLFGRKFLGFAFLILLHFLFLFVLFFFLFLFVFLLFLWFVLLGL